MTCRGGLGSQESLRENIPELQGYGARLVSGNSGGGICQEEGPEKTKPPRLKQDWLLEESLGQRGECVGNAVGSWGSREGSEPGESGKEIGFHCLVFSPRPLSGAVSRQTSPGWKG